MIKLSEVSKNCLFMAIYSSVLISIGCNHLEKAESRQFSTQQEVQQSQNKETTEHESEILTGVINRTESDVNGLFSIWLNVDDTMYMFVVRNVDVTGGAKSELIQGTSVRIKYKNLELSEMDHFYYGDVMKITILKR